MKSYNILYVDDEIENLTSFKFLFKKNFRIHIANSAKEGLETLKEEEIQVVISDQRMPEITGIEFLEQVSNDHPDIIRILLTGYSETLPLLNAVDQGKIYKCLSKPFDRDEMKLILNNALQLYESKNQD